MLCLAGDFCLPSGKIAPCLAKEVGESQTRLIHLQIMQRAAFGSISFFISFFCFFSIKKTNARFLWRQFNHCYYSVGDWFPHVSFVIKIRSIRNSQFLGEIRENMEGK